MKLLHELKDKPIMKIVTGIRRSGKSYLLEHFADELMQQYGVKESCIQYINFESLDYEGSYDYRGVYKELKENFIEGSMNYVFLDEVQEVSDFERLLDGLHVRKDVDVYVTGSNAWMLSSELATLISGRYVQIHMLPFSFSEFVEYTSGHQALSALSQNALLDHYIAHSSFPLAIDISLATPEGENAYLRDLYDTVLNKDVLTRFRINNKRGFENVLRFALGHIGSMLSPGNMAATMRADGQAVDDKTINRYLDILHQIFLLYQVQRFDIRGKKQLATKEKHYCVDVGLRRALLGRGDHADRGHLLENVVYLELIRRGFQVWVGNAQAGKEVDFVTKDGRGNMGYYQVAWTAIEPTTHKRELAPLLEINDNYPKYLLTTDEFDLSQDGIIHSSVAGWLLQEQSQ